ncbi:nitrilase family protein [Antarcticibacterium sp. 1MA-6-2]|uniref:nitrilase family protein n=1 Tax=Antarcticibacterium sp. 1MA-6-2 TaxID=2908210 RepID=UPI001F46A34C|nr:nitrilase family protein [Antarcticibacterium sp. 1MA-6-2]UJH90191.1 nitrilase family protein [Antarcticibacterium sp. 1MA-6-2]
MSNTKKNLKISTAQFEHQSGNKAYNLSVIEKLAGEAARCGAEAIAFHECSVTGYTFARDCSQNELLAIAEEIPGGDSIMKLIEISAKHNIAILVGLFEKDKENNIYNSYVCVYENRVVAKYRKLHPFINPHLVPGENYCVFELFNWKFGILLCYDNNIVENVRATRLLGAEVIFMPHVTMCTPSTRPGAGFVDPKLWEKRVEDPTSLRIEFEGLKGRRWLMKWLPARAYDNAIYIVFSNPIGMDQDQLKNGCSMILDPFGDILCEARILGNEVITATLSPGKLKEAGGWRYIEARRPELYKSILSQDHTSEQKVAWLSRERDQIKS